LEEAPERRGHLELDDVTVVVLGGFTRAEDDVGDHALGERPALHEWYLLACA